jgi:ATP-dependent protease HslVU (ClpYQ) ATPase subunit
MPNEIDQKITSKNIFIVALPGVGRTRLAHELTKGVKTLRVNGDNSTWFGIISTITPDIKYLVIDELDIVGTPRHLAFAQKFLQADHIKSFSGEKIPMPKVILLVQGTKNELAKLDINMSHSAVIDLNVARPY